MDSTPETGNASHSKAGCVTPFTFADGTAGYCVYDFQGKRIDKKPLPGGKTIEDMARLGGVKVQKLPPEMSK